MKFSILVLAAVVSLVSAQNLSGEPSCAVPCLQTAISSAGCQPSDQGCQCGTAKNAIASLVAPCLISNCNASDLSIAESVGLGLCVAYSASLTAASSTPSSSSSPSPSLGPSSTSSTSTTTVTAASTSVPPSSTSPATTSSRASNSSVTMTSAPAPLKSSGAAPGLVAGIGGVVGILALVAAL